MAAMTTGTNANLLQDVFLAKRFVEANRANAIVAKFGLAEDAAHSVGKQVRWQYFGNLNQFTTALSEGADPTSPQSLATTAITATLAEYGTYVEPTKFMLDVAAMGTKAQIVDACSSAAMLTIDTLCYTQALQDTSVTIDSAMTLTAAKVLACVSSLDVANAKVHPATTGGAYYAFIIGPAAAYDLMGEGGVVWAAVKDTTKAPFTDMPFTNGGQIIYGAEMFKTSNIQTAGADDLLYILGDGAFGVVSLDSNLMDPKILITEPGQRVDKPLRNSGTIGCILHFASELIQSNRCVEITVDT